MGASKRQALVRAERLPELDFGAAGVGCSGCVRIARQPLPKRHVRLRQRVLRQDVRDRRPRFLHVGPGGPDGGGNRTVGLGWVPDVQRFSLVRFFKNTRSTMAW